MANSQSTKKPNDPPKIVVLRWGHRPQRDVRLTTHVALTARALCASGFILSDVEDKNIEQTVKKITAHWGGTFQFEMGTPWKKVVRDWKASGGIVVHLTAYGENIQTSDALNRIKNINKDFCSLSEAKKFQANSTQTKYQILTCRVGNQPHSECAALAVFLDRFFAGEELAKDFGGAKMKIVPSARGKKIKSDTDP